MAKDIPGKAQVVVIGGGVVGCSVAYHLAAAGWTDVLLLERKQLTCGTTWHAAGLLGQLRATRNMSRLARYSMELYRQLEAETGQATGLRQNGSLFVASDHERMEELTRGAATAKGFGLAASVVSPSEIRELWPLVNGEDLVGGIHIPSDGQCNPTDLTMALARAARNRGVRIVEGVKVERILRDDRRATGVATELGEVQTDFVVLCGGMWSRELGRACGVNLPLHAAEHFYVVTEAMADLPHDLPVLRDPSACLYFKEDAGKLLVGLFEPVGKPWGMDGIAEDHAFETLPEDWDHVEPYLENAMHRVPALAETGLQTFFNGPESFTPDDRYLLGRTPELDRLYVACGFNSVGIQSAGGAGKVLAEWMTKGRPPMDLWEVDVRRMMPFQGNRRYLHDRTVESLGLLYAMHWPFRQVESARPARTSPVHGRLAEMGACFGEACGWERPNWFAPAGVEPRYEYSYGRQNWYPYSAAEHRAVREGVGVFDQSSFAKLLVQGPDAEAALNVICANDVAVEPGRVVYTQWLNDAGGIEADVTVTRLDGERFLVVSPVTNQVRDHDWLRRHIDGDARATVTDVTSGTAVFGVMGPRSRELLGRLTDVDLSNAAFPFGASREVDLGYARVRLSRVTYVGELGWEVYVPTEFAAAVFDVILREGEHVGLAPAGMHAMNSLRSECGYRHWGHDITEEDTPLEAGLGFAVAFGKGHFIGREALLRQKETGPTRRIVNFALSDPEPLIYHEEPILRDGGIVGRITSGAYGHTLGRAVGMGYVEHPAGVSREFVTSGTFEIEVAGTRVPAEASLRPLYDPKRERVKS